MMREIYWAKLQLNTWAVYVAATEKGLCYIGTPNDPFEVMEKWLFKHVKDIELIERQEGLQTYTEQLQAYMKGECKEFTMPLDLYGTDFQKKVWGILQTIPYGETCSYMEVAEKLQNPRAVRAVGGAVGANPVLIAVPCHRVVTKDGKLGGFRAGLSMKKKLLALEHREVK